MASQSQRGYHYGSSRETASGRTGSGERDRRGFHLPPPGSTSGLSGDVHVGTRGQLSAFAGPASQYTPEVVLTEAEHEAGEEDDIASSSEDEEEALEGAEGYKSGAERLAEKRKMKRFRLTHAQTRYLMNEFAHQAHPNAEQRERLSRDIPGLSPRQVQVWFQNRRAKLKRLTTDDQERMMRSRALPEDFDFAQTLQPNLRDARSPYETMPSLHNLSLSGGGMQQRPALDLGSQRRYATPTAMSSVYTNFLPSAGSATGSANLSPVSSINEGSQYSGSQYSENLSPLSASTHRAGPFSRSNSLSAPSQGHRHQVEQSRQRSATDIPPNPVLVENSTAYRDYEPQSGPHTSHFPQIPPQRATTFPQGLEPPQMVSPLESPNAAAYRQRQTTYPPSVVGPGYYGSSYATQNVDFGGWQSGQLAPEAPRYDLSNQPTRAFVSPPARQSHNNLNPGSDPHSYDQVSSYQYAGSPRFSGDAARQSFYPSSDTHAGNDSSRGRGGNLPGYEPRSR